MKLDSFIIFALSTILPWKLASTERLRIVCKAFETLPSEGAEDILLNDFCDDILYRKPSGALEPNLMDSLDPIRAFRDRNSAARLFISISDSYLRHSSEAFPSWSLRRITSYLNLVNAQGLDLEISDFHISIPLIAALAAHLRANFRLLTISIDTSQDANTFRWLDQLRRLIDDIDYIHIFQSQFNMDQRDHKLVYDASNITEQFLLAGIPPEKMLMGLPSVINYSKNVLNSHFDDFDYYGITRPRPSSFQFRSNLCSGTELINWRPTIIGQEQLLWHRSTDPDEKFAMQFGSSLVNQVWTLGRLGATGIVIYDLPYFVEKNPICRKHKSLFVRAVRSAVETLVNPPLARNIRSAERPAQFNGFKTFETRWTKSYETSHADINHSQEMSARQQMKTSEENIGSTHFPLKNAEIEDVLDYGDDNQALESEFEIMCSEAHSSTSYWLLSYNNECHEFKEYFQVDDQRLAETLVAPITLVYDRSGGIIDRDQRLPKSLLPSGNAIRELIDNLIIYSNGTMPQLILFPSIHEAYPIPILIEWEFSALELSKHFRMRLDPSVPKSSSDRDRLQLKTAATSSVLRTSSPSRIQAEFVTHDKPFKQVSPSYSEVTKSTATPEPIAEPYVFDSWSKMEPNVDDYYLNRETWDVDREDSTKPLDLAI